MRLLSVALLTCVLALPAHAADVAWLPRWGSQGKAAYDVERCKRETVGDRRQDVCVKGRIEIEVLRSDSRGSLQRWKSDTMIDGLSVGAIPEAAAQGIRKVAGMALDIEFDNDAQLVRLVNEAEVRSALQGVVGALARVPVDGSSAQAMRLDVLRSMMSQIIRTQQGLLALVGKDADILYGPLGAPLPIGRTVRVDGTLPSPFGGAFRSAIDFSARPAASGSEGFDLQIDQTADRASMVEAMQGLLKSMKESGSSGLALETREGMESLTDFSRSTTYRVQLASPWASHVRWQQVMKMEGRERVETIDFKRTL